jgi:hypothetical protein
MGGGSEQVYVAKILSQCHCAPLQAISGSFIHLFWVSLLLMGSSDLVEHDYLIVVIHWHFQGVLEKI